MNATTTHAESNDHRATYCPEDNKIRFYPDWDDSDFDKEHLKEAGYRWASKQECYVCPRWTTKAEDAALAYVFDIEDEDYSPEERAADRAERFEEYRKKRFNEATEKADQFEAGPSVHGFQDQRKADKAAAKHDRVRRAACSQWSKAEYWQRRTSGVIRNALHRSSASVRRKRVLDLESKIRSIQERNTLTAESDRYTDSETGVEYAWVGVGRAGQWRRVSEIEEYDPASDRWLQHYEMRLIYERAMLENEGGAAFDVEMIPGGFFAKHQIFKVNRSPKTKRVVSVQVKGKDHHGNDALVTVNIERLGNDAYRAPTEEELKQFKAAQKAKPKTPGLFNPSLEDCHRLQALMNSKHKEGNEVSEMTQAEFKQHSRCTDMIFTMTLFADGSLIGYRPSINKKVNEGVEIVGKLRVMPVLYGRPDSVVHLTDKPSKPIPLDWEKLESIEAVKAN